MAKKPKPYDLITFTQASELYGFTADYFYKLAKRGRIKAKRLGHFWVTTPADVEEFIKSRKPTGVYRADIK